MTATREISLPEALYTVAEADNCWRPMTTAEWLTAVGIVDRAFPVTGYVTVEGEADEKAFADLVEHIDYVKTQDEINFHKENDR